jgi:predicted nucleic acid-binding protein
VPRIILLDTGPLGYVTYPKDDKEHIECKQWLDSLVLRSVDVRIPEIADYELRRGYLRTSQHAGLKRLDQLKSVIGYEPITTAAMLKAAEFWATVRKQGFTTADDKALDADVILAAQADILRNPESDVIVATTNTKHLNLLVAAREWQDIHP